jgi:hypothetical protein
MLILFILLLDVVHNHAIGKNISYDTFYVLWMEGIFTTGTKAIYILYIVKIKVDSRGTY